MARKVVMYLMVLVIVALAWFVVFGTLPNNSQPKEEPVTVHIPNR